MIGFVYLKVTFVYAYLILRILAIAYLKGITFCSFMLHNMVQGGFELPVQVGSRNGIQFQKQASNYEPLVIQLRIYVQSVFEDVTATVLINMDSLTRMKNQVKRSWVTEDIDRYMIVHARA